MAEPLEILTFVHEVLDSAGGVIHLVSVWRFIAQHLSLSPLYI